MEKESLIEKLDRERRERRDQRQNDSRTQQIIQSTESGSRPINLARREEASRRFTELRSPSQPAARPSSPAAPTSGKAVTFYAWKDGAVGTVQILTEGEFTPI